MTDFEVIEKNVLQWAHDRKIIDFDNHRQMYLQVLRTQCLKLTEEIGELHNALYHADKDLLVDALGDSLVVMTSIAWAIPGPDKVKMINLYKYAVGVVQEYTNLSNLIGFTLGELASAIIKNKPGYEIKLRLERLTLYLYQLAQAHNLYLKDCYEVAYNVIKNRTGKTIDGNFIKEGD